MKLSISRSNGVSRFVLIRRLSCYMSEQPHVRNVQGVRTAPSPNSTTSKMYRVSEQHRVGTAPSPNRVFGRKCVQKVNMSDKRRASAQESEQHKSSRTCPTVVSRNVSQRKRPERQVSESSSVSDNEVFEKSMDR